MLKKRQQRPRNSFLLLQTAKTKIVKSKNKLQKVVCPHRESNPRADGADVGGPPAISNTPTRCARLQRKVLLYIGMINVKHINYTCTSFISLWWFACLHDGQGATQRALLCRSATETSISNTRDPPCVTQPLTLHTNMFMLGFGHVSP